MSDSTRKVIWHLGWLVFFVAATTLLLMAHEVQAAQPKPCEKFHGVHAGKKVPCTGILGPEKMVRDAVKAMMAWLPKCKKEFKLEQQKRKADAERSGTVLKIETERGNKCCELALRPRPITLKLRWYETTTFNVVVAIAVAGLVVGGFTALLYETEIVKL